MNFTVTEATYDRLASIIKEEDNDAIVGLRIYVKGGGCSGFQYGFEFAEEVKEDDSVFENEYGIKVIIDPMSMMYLDGATIDYVRNIEGEHFAISNPAVTSTCGCGNSFSA